MMGPLKDETRGNEKIREKYCGNVRKLLDVVRFSVMCKDLESVGKAIDHVKKDTRCKILRIKSGFDPSQKVINSGGYRDVKLNVRHVQTQHVVEIQLQIFLMFKRDGGHRLYVAARKFAEEGIISSDGVLLELTPALQEEMAKVACLELEETMSKFGKNSR